MSITVLLADDHAVVRDGLRYLLDAQPDIRVIGDAASGLEAVRRTIESQPDVVVMDIAMPELNGIEATRRIVTECPAVRVVILSMHATAEHVYRALQAGARGYVLKASAGAEVVAAVRSVHAGQRYLTPHVSDLVVDDYLRQRTAAGAADPLDRLSPREREILQLVAEGHTSADIAGRLSLSPKSVDTYRSRLMAKLGIDNLPDLTRFAIRHGLISLESP
jgi:DNA-binding NarL/FixJ family response regulator